MGIRQLLFNIRDRVEGNTLEIWEEIDGRIAVYANGLTFAQNVLATIYPLPSVTAPAQGAINIALKPTLTSAEGTSALYVLAYRTTADQASVGNNTDLIFNAVSDDDVALNTSTGVFTLKAGLEYELTGCPNLSSFNSANAYCYFQWVLASDNTPLPDGQSGSIVPVTHVSSDIGTQPVAKATYRPTVDTGVKLRVWDMSGTCSMLASNSWATVRATALRYLDYTAASSLFQIRRESDGVIVYDAGFTSGLSVTLSTALKPSTLYGVRVRHKDTFSDNVTSFTTWQTFTTTA